MSLRSALSTRRFGELLVERGWVTPDQLADALRARSDPRERLGQTLVRLGVLKERDVTELLGEQFSLAWWTPSTSPRRTRRRCSSAPLSTWRGRPCCSRSSARTNALDVAVGDPLDAA